MFIPVHILLVQEEIKIGRLKNEPHGKYCTYNIITLGPISKYFLTLRSVRHYKKRLAIFTVQDVL
jgi:hypothetical protein